MIVNQKLDLEAIYDFESTHPETVPKVEPFWRRVRVDLFGKCQQSIVTPFSAFSRRMHRRLRTMQKQEAPLAQLPPELLLNIMNFGMWTDDDPDYESAMVCLNVVLRV